MRKSIYYRTWIEDQKQMTNTLHGQFNRFQLNVHLMNNNDVQKKAKSPIEGDVACESPAEVESTIETLAEGDVARESPAEGESVLETAIRETTDINTTESTLESPVSDEIYNQILNELKADPNLSQIMASIEEIWYDEYAMEVEVSDDERLEHELI